MKPAEQKDDIEFWCDYIIDEIKKVEQGAPSPYLSFRPINRGIRLAPIIEENSNIVAFGGPR